jgi:predicted RNA binding protein YcfA (HicA-like mRNA interferase family)
MPKAPRLTAAEAEAMLSKAGFVWLRSKGSHRIYGETLHPKVIKQVLQAIEEASVEPIPPD